MKQNSREVFAFNYLSERAVTDYNKPAIAVTAIAGKR